VTSNGGAHIATSVAMSEDIHRTLANHLLATRGEEDLAFALYTPSRGRARLTAMVNEVMLPTPGDRQQHGNVSFNLQYLERVLERASKISAGIAFLHSHLGPGWQDMSPDDLRAEQRIAGPCVAVTGLPLVGLTLGTDHAWSARFWQPVPNERSFRRMWCSTVRVVGRQLSVTFDPAQNPAPTFRKEFERTRTVWGANGHQHLARIHVGIVGLGSVGMAVAEGLARMGFERISLIDFDEVQSHNLDRLQGATKRDLGKLKIKAASTLVKRSSTAANLKVTLAAYSVVEAKGRATALDCDVLISCVDRPRARQTLNHIAYSHLVPVIDGGIAVRFREGAFVGAEWQVQIASPTRPCLECLGVFSSGDADTERAGMLDDPSYMSGLEEGHHLKRNENVYPFAMNLASMELFQLVSFAGKIARFDTVGVQRLHLVAGMLETDDGLRCKPHCDMSEFVAKGDSLFSYVGRDFAADRARARQERK
jgi:molybdopterin-synthase adenylyltransferase